MTAVQDPKSVEDLRAFVDRCHGAIEQQSQGKPMPFLDLWSRAPDVSIMAAIGGYQVGYEAVSELLIAASSTQHFDGWSAENVSTILADDLAVTVELKHYSRAVDGREQTMTLRATQVYRRESDEWRVVHRHGDVLAPIEAQW